MLTQRTFWGLVLAVALALTFGVRSASADTISFDLAFTNLSGFPGPYVTVTVSTPAPNSTTATVTFTSQTQSGFTYLLGGAQAANLNVNATSFTSSIGTVGSQQADGFGNFNLTFDNPDGFNQAVPSIVFVLTNTGGTWASASNVLAPNNVGATAAAHIFVASLSCTGACATGFSGNVPEPSSLLLLGSGLVSIGLWGRKKFMSKFIRTRA